MKDTTLATLVPKVKRSLETVIFQVKGMLLHNDCPSDAFFMGNLKHRDLEGREVSANMPREEDDKENEDTDTHDDCDTGSDADVSDKDEQCVNNGVTNDDNEGREPDAESNVLQETRLNNKAVSIKELPQKVSKKKSRGQISYSKKSAKAQSPSAYQYSDEEETESIVSDDVDLSDDEERDASDDSGDFSGDGGCDVSMFIDDEADVDGDEEDNNSLEASPKRKVSRKSSLSKQSKRLRK